MIINAQELYDKLSTDRRWVERALLALAGDGGFVGQQAETLLELARKLQDGIQLSYSEFMQARSELRRQTYVAKLVRIALAKGAERERGQDTSPKRQEQSAEQLVEPAWFSGEPRLVKGRRFYEPPRWINARLDQKCNRCGTTIYKGFKALWFPSTRGNTCMCPACGEAYLVAERVELGEATPEERNN